MADELSLPFDDDPTDYAFVRGRPRPVRDAGGLARFGDPDTSHAAATKISESCEKAIRQLFAIPRALTDDEIVSLLPEWYAPTVKSARSRLSNKGLLVDSGASRPSNRGVQQIVWRLGPNPETGAK